MTKRVTFILAMALLFTGATWADTQDPAIIIRGGVTSGTIHLTPGNLTTTIVFDTDPRCSQVMLPIPGTSTLVPSMTCHVVNESGLNLTSLVFTIVPAQLPLTLNNNSFGSWTTNAGFTIATFTFATALTSPNEFDMDLIGFSPGTPIGFTGTPVPEPASLGLFALGLGGAWVRRRIANKKK